MFDRILYKRQAWQQFKERMALPIVCSVLLCAVGLICGSVWIGMMVSNKMHFMPVAFLLLCSGLGVYQMVFCYVSLKMTRTPEPLPMSDILVAIKEYWQDGILGILYQMLWIFLWSLLFFIPGIVKTFSYSMTFFVLVENPGIGVKKAMDISKILTNGHKSDLFVMNLSFCGWMILAYLKKQEKKNRHGWRYRKSRSNDRIS